MIKQLQKLNKHEAAKILDGIEQYAKTPFEGAYRLRIGDYRVVFYEEEDLILISKIAHRKQVYL